MRAVLQHHGVKGQQWGVRKYQYADGSLTPAGRKRYNKGTAEKVSSMMSQKASYAIKSVGTQLTGRQYVDGYLKSGTTFARIQTSSNFENFAFYATYKKADSEKYMGLFGKNLTRRAAKEADKAEKQSNATGSEEDIARAKELREKSDNLKVYQLKIESTKKLKIPSDDNAADITAKLLKEKDFKDNLQYSVDHAKEIMKRPQQQILFTQAQNALKKNPNDMTNTEKIAVYKALNLSLVNHDPREIATQNRFYDELKKKGYNALLDYNDKQYSSYHAKRPMIVFDTDSVALKSVSETNPKVVNKLYVKYNTERVAKEAVASTLGIVSKLGHKTVSECDSYVRQKTEDYLNDSGSTKSKSEIISEYKKEHPNTKLTNSQIVNNYNG